MVLRSSFYVSLIVLRQFNRYQSFEDQDRFLDGTSHALEFGLLYDNTDFSVNPSKGSKQYVSLRAMMAGLVVRADVAGSEEGGSLYGVHFPPSLLN